MTSCPSIERRAPVTTMSLFAVLFGMHYAAIVVPQFVGQAQGARRDSA